MATNSWPPSHLISLPQDVLLHIARSFLVMSDLISLGRTSMSLLQLTQRCDLIGVEMDLGVLIRDRGESDAIFAELTRDQQLHMMQTFVVKEKNEHGKAKQKVPPSSVSPRSIEKTKYAIGRINRVSISSTYGNRVLKHFLPLLHLLPASIKSIKLSANREIKTPQQCRFPAHLQRLVLCGHFAQPIMNLSLPAAIRELIIQPEGYFYGSLEEMKLPPCLTVLHLGTPSTDQPIDLVLPATLTELKLGFYFDNFSVNELKLPEGLLTLIFTHPHFNPPSFEHLKLPSSLTNLELGRAFDQPFMSDWSPPLSLTRLQLPSSCPLPGNDIITLTHCLFTFQLPDRTSSSSSSSTIIYTSCLVAIEVFSNDSNFLKVASLYPSITSIDLGSHNGESMSELQPPSQLRELIVGRTYNYTRPNARIYFPETLTRLQYRSLCNLNSSDFTFPSRLECLNVNGLESEQLIAFPPKGRYPASLKRIELYEASDKWLCVDVSEACEFYESGASGIYRHVSERRIHAAKLKAKETAEFMKQFKRASERYTYEFQY